MTDLSNAPASFAGPLTLTLNHSRQDADGVFNFHGSQSILMRPMGGLTTLSGMVKLAERSFLLVLEGCTKPPPYQEIGVYYPSAKRVVVNMSAQYPQLVGVLHVYPSHPKTVVLIIRSVSVEPDIELIKVNFKNLPAAAQRIKNPILHQQVMIVDFAGPPRKKPHPLLPKVRPLVAA